MPLLVNHSMGLLTGTQSCGLCMHRECRERVSRHRLQRKPLVSNPGMNNGACVTHMHIGIANPRWRGNVPGIPGACVTRNFAYLVRGPCNDCYQTAGLMTRQINKGRDGKHSAALKRLHFAVDKNKSFMNILNNRGPKRDTRGASLRGLPMNFWCGLSSSCVVSVGTDSLPETHGQA